MSARRFRALFNGRDLAGWRHVGAGRFVVESGLLVAEGGMGLLWYHRERFDQALLRVVYRVPTRDDNSGVFVRLPAGPNDPWEAVDGGYEVQIHEAADSDLYCTGALYSFAPATARPGRVGEWNVLEIALEQRRTAVTLNGVPVCAYTEGDPVPRRRQDSDPRRGPRPLAGFIGLQNHAPGETAQFREVAVGPLGGA
ncbi:MAG TPA: DUF1080 domain-containing protein [Pelomicrobium sp.]|nr:DUF1080 domain-containing protein [Pelomicrobium sp.]